MSRSRIGLLVGGSLVVAALWTALTGQWWHWFPVAAAIAMTYGMIRSSER